MDKQVQGVLNLQPHDHACLIYESESEWRDNVIPFIITGLKQGEKCVYGLNHRSRQYIIDCLQEEGINVAAYVESGQLLILDKSVLPGECASDRLDQIQDFCIQFLEQSLAQGYPAVRFTNESLYTLLGMGSAHNMVEVNSRMNTVIFPHYPCVVLCQYDRFKTDPKILKYAIVSHPIVIRNNELYVNLSSIHDERFLEITSDRWEAEHWLAVIERENREMEKLQMVNHTLNNSSQPLLCFQADGSVIACNEAFYQLMGHSGENIQHLGEIEPYWQDYLAVVIQELKQRGAHRYEREWPQPDGSRVVLDMSVLAGFDDSENVAYYYASIMDITQHKEAQEALRNSEEKYRLIADNAYDGITIYDSTTFISIYQNPAIKEMLGYPSEAWLNQHLLEYVHPDDLTLVEQKVKEGLEKGEGSIQCRIKKSDSSYIWMEINGRVMHRDSDSPLLLFIVRDISQRKRAEEELIASEARLRYSEQELKQQLDYLNYLINTMSEVFVTYDLNHRITFVNSAVYKQLGYQPEELLGSNVIDFIVPPDKERMATYIGTRLLDGKPGIFETMVKRKNGSEALVRIKSSPIKEEDTVIGVMLLLEDISEYRRIQKEMARLDQLNTVGEIAAGIGHEIRNPMTTVQGFLQILSQDEDFIHHQQYFSLMLDELERANAIISEFLALAKNKLVDLQPRNLNSIITAIFPLLQADAMLVDKSIVLDLSEIPDLLLDEKEIRQLILNLVRNGLEAMQAGGTVYISTYLKEEQVVLSVQDEGNGIDQDLLDKIGTPFVTTKDNGTGLGLAICYSIVARHEASIHPYTSPTGSTFVISFKIPRLNTGQMALPLV